MKKIFVSIIAGLMVSAELMAVSVKDICGQYDGNLNIGGTPYPDKSVYLLPGVVDGTVTFVLPDFIFNAGKLGNIVLPNIPMDASGKLTLENATLYLDSISERATITILNGLEDGGTVYNSVISTTEAQVLLSIEARSLLEPILVLFNGVAAKSNNYAVANGGFEGAWTNNEPQGWHSFSSATGTMVDFVKDNSYQFIQSSEVRPGSKGAHSAMLSSNMILGVKANGNCTNGQINAGSTTASDGANNYNFSAPENTGFNTPFNGRPDSLVFWAKYLPADRNAANEVNKARVSSVITTADRYQDPEVEDYSNVKIGHATLNYAATSAMGWQRIAVPFEYAETNKAKQPAYILTTFTTNMVPGGGSSYSTGGSFSKTNVLDTLLLDDVEMVYNRNLQSFKRDAEVLNFAGHVATLADNYCDDCAKYAAKGNGVSAQTFIAFDATHQCVFIYVIADDYAQTGEYSLYRVDFADSVTDDLLPLNSAVENVSAGQSFEKVIINGQLFIRRGDTLFNITGARLQ